MPISSTSHGSRFKEGLLTRREVRQLIDSCSERSTSGIRNRAVITVFYRGGLRVSELIHMTEEDIDRETHSLRVGKDGRHRRAALDPVSYELVEEWIRRRSRLELPVGSPLFCTLRGGEISPSYIRALMARLARKAGISKRVSAEVLRRTLAAELVEEGVPIGLIQAQLGHRNAVTTERYVARSAPEGLARVMLERSNWLS